MARDPKKPALALIMALGLAASACASDPEIGAQAEVEETTTSTEASTSTEDETTTSEAPTTEAAEDPEPLSEPSTPDETAASTTAAPTTAAPTTAAPTTEAPAPVAFDIPSVDLTNIKTGETVNLTSVADGKPLVLWFWAPH